MSETDWEGPVEEYVESVEEYVESVGDSGVPIEADPADVEEQRRVVEDPDDDYR
jgi:hypothetical protein